MRWVLLALFALGLAGCPEKTGSKDRPVEAAPVGTGTVDLLVVDDHEKPLPGAVVWALGTKSLEPVPSEPVVLEQVGLEFKPRFLVARKGQTLEVRNSDTEVHNVHSSDACCDMNETMGIGTSRSRRLGEAGEVTFLCNIHAHMRCTLVVLDAISARTDASGHARLTLPLGPRKLRVRALDRERAEIDLVVAPVTTATVVLPPIPPGPTILPPEALPWPTVAVRLGESLDEAVRFARAGNAKEARAAAEEALGTWFTGSGFFAELRNAGDRPHLSDAEDWKTRLRELAPKAENAAEQGGDALAAFEKQVEKIKALLLEVARELPKR